MSYDVRTVRVEDWAKLKELRLSALRDPVARVAFLDTYESGVAEADDHWRRRATPISEGGVATNLIAADEDGVWVAMLALLDEIDDQTVIDAEGDPAPPQMHMVSAYVRPQHRGTGVAEQLFRAAIDWTWRNTKAERIRLWVHADNARAQAFYRRLGFTMTGGTIPFPPVPDEMEYEMALPRP